MRFAFSFLLGSVLCLPWLQAAADDLPVIELFPCDKLAEIQEAAANNDAKAQLRLAKAYLSATCVARDLQEGANWLTKSAILGYPVAQAELAAFLHKGGDDDHAAQMARKAAEQSDPLGEYLLSTFLDNGWGLSKDETEAAKWARRSAEQDFSHAQVAIGFYYEASMGQLPRSFVEADKWYILAQRHYSHKDDNPSLFTLREHLEQHMSPAEIEAAKKRAAEWIAGRK